MRAFVFVTVFLAVTFTNTLSSNAQDAEFKDIDTQQEFWNWIHLNPYQKRGPIEENGFDAFKPYHKKWNSRSSDSFWDWIHLNPYQKRSEKNINLSLRNFRQKLREWFLLNPYQKKSVSSAK